MGRAVGGRAAALLLAGRTVSRFGSSFYLVALPLYVLERTGSLGASGLFFTLEYEAGAPFGAESAIRDLLARDCLVMTKRSKKAKSGFTEVDLIPLIARATVEERRDTIALDLVLRAQNPGLNPELVVAAIREHCPDAAPDFVIFHRRAVLDGQFQTWE